MEWTPASTIMPALTIIASGQAPGCRRLRLQRNRNPGRWVVVRQDSASLALEPQIGVDVVGKRRPFGRRDPLPRLRQVRCVRVYIAVNVAISIATRLAA